MFKDFELDLTYKKKIAHDVAKNDFINENNKNIHVRKNFILMGGNASGKTTLGKILCAIYNYIRGRNIEERALSFKNSIRNKKQEASFEIEFSINNDIFAFKTSFDVNNGLICETVYHTRINKSSRLDKLRTALYLNPISIYPEENKAANLKIGFQSYFAMNKESKEHFDLINNNICYSFSFSEFINDNYSAPLRATSIDLLQTILQSVDSSIDKIMQHQGVNGEIIKTYSILFKNDDKVEVEDGDISNLKNNRLSHGTAEAIYFSAILASLRQYSNGMIFVDEKLSHTHSELEIYLISRIIKRQKMNIQFLYTTHNTDCLDMDIPINCFAFLRRNEDGFNEIVYPDKKFNKNDRRLRNYVQNDFFGTAPNFAKLDNKLGML
jgi:energy-coupling factor transporter ATP-binding protein EcfA2